MVFKPFEAIARASDMVVQSGRDTIAIENR